MAELAHRSNPGIPKTLNTVKDKRPWWFYLFCFVGFCFNFSWWCNNAIPWDAQTASPVDRHCTVNRKRGKTKRGKRVEWMECINTRTLDNVHTEKSLLQPETPGISIFTPNIWFWFLLSISTENKQVTLTTTALINGYSQSWTTCRETLALKVFPLHTPSTRGWNSISRLFPSIR